jgi:hypothetical protein
VGVCVCGGGGGGGLGAGADSQGASNGCHPRMGPGASLPPPPPHSYGCLAREGADAFLCEGFRG